MAGTSDFKILSTSTGVVGPTGSVGPPGDQGVRGPTSGVDMTFDNSTPDSDQGDGKVWFNHATLSSATVIYMDDKDANAASINDWVDSWDDSTSTIKGYVKITKQTDSAVFAIYSISGSVTSASTYSKITISYIVGAGAFADTDAAVVTFSRTGDLGATGPTGSIGPQGP